MIHNYQGSLSSPRACLLREIYPSGYRDGISGEIAQIIQNHLLHLHHLPAAVSVDEVDDGGWDTARPPAKEKNGIGPKILKNLSVIVWIEQTEGDRK
jgi:hypothetical protein